MEENVPDTARMLPDSSNNESDQNPSTTVQIGGGNEEDEEDDRDNAVGAEAQNLLNMQNEIARPMSFMGFLRYVLPHY